MISLLFATLSRLDCQIFIKIPQARCLIEESQCCLAAAESVMVKQIKPVYALGMYEDAEQLGMQNVGEGKRGGGGGGGGGPEVGPGTKVPLTRSCSSCLFQPSKGNGRSSDSASYMLKLSRKQTGHSADSAPATRQPAWSSWPPQQLDVYSLYRLVPCRLVHSPHH